MDADEALVAWQMVQAEAAGREMERREEAHRCPPDMPPCPRCQQFNDEEDEREFGFE